MSTSLYLFLKYIKLFGWNEINVILSINPNCSTILAIFKTFSSVILAFNSRIGLLLYVLHIVKYSSKVGEYCLSIVSSLSIPNKGIFLISSKLFSSIIKSTPVQRLILSSWWTIYLLSFVTWTSVSIP